MDGQGNVGLNVLGLGGGRAWKRSGGKEFGVEGNRKRHVSVG